MRRARYALRGLSASYTRAPILDSWGEGWVCTESQCWPRILPAVVASRPRTGRQAGRRQGAAASLPSTENFPLGPGFHHHGNCWGMEAEFLRIPGRVCGGGKNKNMSPEQTLSGQGQHPKGPCVLSTFLSPFSLFGCFSLYPFLLSLGPHCPAPSLIPGSQDQWLTLRVYSTPGTAPSI